MMKVKTDYEYGENNIFMVWNSYIQKLQLHYFTREGTKETLCKPDGEGMNPIIDAGILVIEGEQVPQLYHNSFGFTVSVCGAVDRTISTEANIGPTLITAHLKTAFEQILLWNFSNEEEIINHQIIFPYHITNSHWALGVIELQFDERGLLTDAVSKIYNPLPGCGGRQLSQEAKDHIQELLQNSFPNEEIELENPDGPYKKQQKDGTSCGVISAENGKDFIQNENRLKKDYHPGAQELREQQIEEVGRADFEESQFREEIDRSNANYQHQPLQGLASSSQYIKLTNQPQIKYLVSNEEDIKEDEFIAESFANFSTNETIEERMVQILQKYKKEMKEGLAQKITSNLTEIIQNIVSEDKWEKLKLQILLNDFSQTVLGLELQLQFIPLHEEEEEELGTAAKVRQIIGNCELLLKQDETLTDLDGDHIYSLNADQLDFGKGKYLEEENELKNLIHQYQKYGMCLLSPKQEHELIVAIIKDIAPNNMEQLILIEEFLKNQELIPALQSKAYIITNRTFSAKALLHIAAEEGDAEIVEILLYCGIDANLPYHQNDIHKTSLELICDKLTSEQIAQLENFKQLEKLGDYNNYTGVIAALVDYGAKLSVLQQYHYKQKEAEELLKAAGRIITQQLNLKFELLQQQQQKLEQQVHKLEQDISVIPEEQWQLWRQENVNKDLLQKAATSENIDLDILESFRKFFQSQLRINLHSLTAIASGNIEQYKIQSLFVKLIHKMFLVADIMELPLKFFQNKKQSFECQEKVRHIFSNKQEDIIIEDYAARITEFLQSDIMRYNNSDPTLKQRVINLIANSRAEPKLKKHWESLAAEYILGFIAFLRDTPVNNINSHLLGQKAAEAIIPSWFQHDFALDCGGAILHIHHALCLASVSQLAYEPFEKIKWIVQDQWNFPLYQIIEVKSNRSLCFGDQNKIITAFRGTDNRANILQDLDAYKVEIKIGELTLQVHRGFLKATKMLWDEHEINQDGKLKHYSLKSFLAQIKQHQQSDMKFYFTGHSLGGAMANIAALLAIAELELTDQFEVYTYGQPRWCGKESLAAARQLLGDKVARVTNKDDIVPRIPPESWGFVHPEEELTLTTGAQAEALAFELQKNHALGRLSKGLLTSFTKLPLILVSPEQEWLMRHAVDPVAKAHKMITYAPNLTDIWRQNPALVIKLNRMQQEQEEQDPEDEEIIEFQEENLEADLIREETISSEEQAQLGNTELSEPLNKQLWSAINNKNLEEVEELLKSHLEQININAQEDGDNKDSFIHRSVRLNLGAITKLLRDAGADPYKTISNESAIDLAIRLYKPDALKALMEFDEDIINRLSEFEREKLIIKLVITDQLEALKVQLPSNQENLGGIDQAKLLNWAVVCNNRPIVDYFLDEIGFDANQVEQSGYGLAPLTRAALEGLTDMAELLINKGAEINQKQSQDGTFPLGAAACNGHLELVQLLIQREAKTSCATSDGTTPLHFAVRGHLEVAQFLVRNGLDINQAKENGDTPLLDAISHNHPGVAKWLVEEGADIHKANNNGFVPFWVAAQKGFLELMQFLIEKGADIHAVDTSGRTALWTAAYEGDQEVVRWLLEVGAVVDQANENGATPLHAAAQQGQVKVAQLLKERGANINAIMQGGFTPLWQAVYDNQFEMVQFLLEHGASVNQVDDQGSTLIDAAKTNEVRKLLQIYQNFSDHNFGSALELIINEQSFDIHMIVRHTHKYIITEDFVKELMKLIGNRPEPNEKLLILKLLNYFYIGDENSYKEITTVSNEHELFNIVSLFKAWSLLKLGKYLEAITFFDDLSKKISMENEFENSLFKYVKAEHYFRKGSYSECLAEISDIEEDINPLVSFKLLRAYANYMMKVYDFELDIESLKKPYLAPSEIALYEDFATKMAIRQSEHNAQEKLLAYQELAERLDNLLQELVVDLNILPPNILLKLDLAELNALSNIEVCYGYQLFDAEIMIPKRWWNEFWHHKPSQRNISSNSADKELRL